MLYQIACKAKAALRLLTNHFSKKLENLKAAFALHCLRYNFCRVHRTLRCTPAQEAGLVASIWEMEDVLEAV